MSYLPYSYKQVHPRRFVFYSLGKKHIEKIAEFTPIGIDNLVNLGFGDLRPDGSVDDIANSNNGDLIKVLSTVIEILKHFTAQHPDIIIHFKGSSEERDRLYRRILNTYYSSFVEDFDISALTLDKEKPRIVPFDPLTKEDYARYFIKRIT